MNGLWAQPASDKATLSDFFDFEFVSLSQLRLREDEFDTQF